MKTKHFKLFILFLLLISTFLSVQAEDLRRIVSLSGSWRFSIGDDSKWAIPSFDDSGWDQISVPGKWEEQGYDDYNGYAWYRKTFRINDIPADTPIFLILGRIDDVDEVYLNGKEIGKTGKFPPDYKSAYDKNRKYFIPTDLINANGDNVISVKVYDSYQEGGIVEGPTGIYIDEDNELLSLNLSGKWKFRTGDNKGWRFADYNDEGWSSIGVPSVWENQGYEDYDGYGWYRLKFSLPKNLTTGELYLSLGKIDDIDDVYLNGEHIGTVNDVRREFGYRNSGGEYNVRRIYKIREGLLSRDGSNIIAVRVYDEQGVGGIYEGPVGIMSADNARRYKNRHHNDYNNRYNSFWDYMFNKFFGNDNSYYDNYDNDF
jgi:hypothetical protein